MPRTPRISAEKVIKGAWWDSEFPDRRAAGEMLISPEGEVSLVLETIALRSSTELPGFDEKFESRTFWGHDQHGHAWSLFGCVWIGSQNSVARMEHRRSVSYAVLGLHAAKIDDVVFDEIEVDFNDLQEWLCTPMLREKHEHGSGLITIAVPPLDPREYPTQCGYTVILRPWTGGRSSYREVSVTIQQNMALKFVTPANLRELSKILLDLKWFITLGQGEPVQILEVTGRCEGVCLRGSEAPQIIEVYHLWAGKQVERRPKDRHEMVFTMQDIGTEFGVMFDRWHTYREKHAPVLSCYFATRFNESLYGNHRFLFLAHALELYHQLNFPGNHQPQDEFKARIDAIVAAVPGEEKWLRERLSNANRLTLVDRLRALISAKKNLIGGLISDTEEFVAVVRDTRNYYTHYDDRLKRSGRVAEGVELMKLTVRMRMFLEACFLSDLGAPARAISTVLKDDRTYVPAP